MNKAILPILLISILFCYPISIVPAYATQSATIYATSDALVPDYVNWFHTYAPYATGVEDGDQIKSVAEGCLTFGFFHVLALSEIHPRIKTIVPSTLKITYYGNANKSDVAQFNLWMVVVNETTKHEWLDLLCPLEVWGEAMEGYYPYYYVGEDTCAAFSPLIQTSNKSLVTYYDIENRVPVDPSWYAIVEWGLNKTTTDKLTANLYFDAQTSPVNPTMIQNIRYEISLFTGALSPLWYLLLPILYTVCLALYFFKEKKSTPSPGEIVLIVTGFILACVLTPIALNILYGV